MEEMEYRVNFLTWLLIQTAWLSSDFIFFSVITSIGPIGTWQSSQALVAFGVLRFLLFPVWGWMFENFSRLPELVSSGKLDLLLTKPVDSQFIVSSRRFLLSTGISNIIGGVFLILVGLNRLQISISPIQLILFVWNMLVGTALMYGMYFLSVCLVLYTDRINNIHHLFTSLYDASRLPKEVYSGLIRIILTFIIPIAIMVNTPAETLFKFPDWTSWVVLHLLAVFFLFISRTVWLKGLSRYSSASS